MLSDRVSIHAREMSDIESENDSVVNGGPSSRPTTPDLEVSSKKQEKRKRKRTVSSDSETSSSDSESSDSNSEDSSSDDNDSDSDKEQRNVRTVRHNATRSVSAETLYSYTRFNPESSSKKILSGLSQEQLDYAKKYFCTFLRDDTVQANILDTAPIPADAIFEVKEMDDFVFPTINKLGASIDRGAEKGIQSIQKKILRTMGPISKLWAMMDSLRKRSKSTAEVDEVDIDTMSNYMEKIVCLLGQANLSVDRHRRIHTMLLITEDYKKAKQLLDDNEEKLKSSGNKLFGDEFKRVLKKASKVQDDATLIVKGLAGKRKKPKDKKNFHYKKSRRERGSGGFRNFQDREYPRPHFYDHQSRVPFQDGPSDFQSYPGGHNNSRGRGGHRGSDKRRPGPSHKRSVSFNSKYIEDGNKNKTRLVKFRFIKHKRKCYDNDKEPAFSHRKLADKSTRRGEIAAFHLKLAQNHKRPIHNPDSKGLSFRIRNRPVSGKIATLPKIKHSRDPHSQRGNSKSPSEKGNRDCKRFKLQRPIPQPNVCSPQKRWRKSSSHKFKISKQLHSLSTFQDGGSAHGKRSVEKTGLALQNRFKGRLSDGKFRSKSKKICKIPMGRDTLSVQSNPVRSGFSTKNFYQTIQTSNKLTEKNRDKTDYLPGRHFADGKIASNFDKTSRHNYLHPTKFGVHHKLGKVSTYPMSKDRILRVSNKHTNNDVSSTPRQGKSYKRRVSQSSKLPSNNNKRTRKTYRKVGFNSPSNFTCKSPMQTLANASNKGSFQGKKLRVLYKINNTSQRRNILVASSNRFLKRKDHNILHSRYSPYKRCVKSRLGRNLLRKKNGGCMDSARTINAHKRKRTFSSFLRNKSFHQIRKQYYGSFKNGQYYRGGIHKQNGGHQIRQTSAVNKRNLGLVRSKKHNIDCRTFTRKVKSHSRLGVQKQSGCKRLDARQNCIQHDKQNFRPLRYRSFCKSLKLSASKVHKLASGPRRSISGRFSKFLVRNKRLRISSNLSDRQMFGKNSKRKSNNSLDNPDMASTTLVPSITTNVYRGTNQNSLLQQPAEIFNGQNSSFVEGSVPSHSGMEGFGGPPVTNELSEQAKKLHYEAWRPGTRASYNSAWSRWVSWCVSRQINPIQSSVANIIEFLTLLYNEKKAYRTINTYRSAISRNHNLVNGIPVGQQRDIVHHLRAIFNARTPLPKYQSSWNVDIVINHIKSLGDNSKLSLKQLTQKLTMLLALTSAGRASELHKFNIDFMLDKGSHILFKIPKLTKTCKPGKCLPEVKFFTFTDKLICVVDCLRSYLEVTANVRNIDNKINRKWLLLSFVKPHHPVTTSSISRWLKCLIHESGIDASLFTAHSTRSASTSKALRSGLSTREIMEQARWSLESTFTRFYNKPLLDESCNYQEAVLSRS